MSLKSQIPNLITLGNLLCGVLAIIVCLMPGLCYQLGFHPADAVLLLVGVALLCDFLDGAVARLLRATSPLGAQLDSLSDLVTFGVLPGILTFLIFFSTIEIDLPIDIGGEPSVANPAFFQWPGILAFLSLLLPLASAYRLAKFNIDTRPQDVFYGLPTPASGIFFTCLFWISLRADAEFLNQYILHPYALPGTIILFAFLMVSDFPLLSFKFKTFALRPNISRYLLLGISLILLIVWSIKAVPAIMLAYFLLSIVDRQLINRTPG